MKYFKMIICLGVLFLFLGMATISCEKEGTMEKAGKKVDETVDSAKKTVDK